MVLLGETQVPATQDEVFSGRQEPLVSVQHRNRMDRRPYLTPSAGKLGSTVKSLYDDRCRSRNLMTFRPIHAPSVGFLEPACTLDQNCLHCFLCFPSHSSNVCPEAECVVVCPSILQMDCCPSACCSLSPDWVESSNCCYFFDSAIALQSIY